MSWIALKMLVGDKAKFFGIVLGLTFAALLIMQQGSIFCGLMLRTAGQITDITGADLWVMDHSVRYVDDVKPMLESNLYRVRGVEGVRWAVPLYKGNARVRVNPKERKANDPVTIEQVILLGLDDASLVGAPRKIVVGDLLDLRKPDAVIVDNTRLEKLYPQLNPIWGRAPKVFAGRRKEKQEDIPESEWKKEALIKKYGKDEGERLVYKRFLSKELEMNDRRAVIVGICVATRTFQSNPVVYTTYSRAKQFAPQERKILSYVLVKVEGTDDEKLSWKARENLRTEVATRIKKKTGLRARTSDEFLLDTIMYYMKYTGIPINFGITAMLGFLVGTAIAGQTFYNFTLENLKQFGALKAMGATNLRIVGMILLQATVVGFLGYGIGVGLAAGFGIMTSGGELAFYTWWPILPITGVAVVFICILSSLLSIRRVMVLEPAVVFR